MNQHRVKALVHRLTQATHVHINDIGLRIEMQIPHLLQQHLARHHLVGMPQQEYQQFKLARSQLQRTPGTLRGTRQQINRNIRIGEVRLGIHLLTTTQQHFHPRQQLAKA